MEPIFFFFFFLFFLIFQVLRCRLVKGSSASFLLLFSHFSTLSRAVLIELWWRENYHGETNYHGEKNGHSEKNYSARIAEPRLSADWKSAKSRLGLIEVPVLDNLL